MAASKQSRASKRAAIPPAPEPAAGKLPDEAVLHVRLWDGENPQTLPWPLSESSEPPICLTMDIISACGGSISETRGLDLVARFPTFQDGVLAARRIQWASQGLSEALSFESTAVSVLVQSGDEAVSPDAKDSSLRAVAEIAAGKILFTPKAATVVESLPGFVLSRGTDAMLREFEWRGPIAEQTRSKDDEAIAHLIEKMGPKAKARAYPAPLSPAPSSSPETSAPISPRQAVEIRARSSSRMFGQPKGRVLWVGGIAFSAVMLLAAVPVFHLLGHPTPSPIVPNSRPANGDRDLVHPPGNGEVNQSQAKAPQTQSPSATSKVSSPETKRDRSAPKGEPGKGKAVVDQAESQPRRGCDLDQNEVQAQLGQAENNRARGKYEDAKRQFESVLACDPRNEQATRGLKMVRQAESQYQ